MDVRVYAVWVPILWSDFESRVPSATKRLGDKRVTHYWDGKGVLVKSFSRVLNLPGEQPAWDVYLLFNRDAEWKNDPPTPGYWMHQLDLAPEQRLDGTKLAAETNKLLQEKRQ